MTNRMTGDRSVGPGVRRWNAQAHVHVVRQPMTFQQLPPSDDTDPEESAQPDAAIFHRKPSDGTLKPPQHGACTPTSHGTDSPKHALLWLFFWPRRRTYSLPVAQYIPHRSEALRVTRTNAVLEKQPMPAIPCRTASHVRMHRFLDVRDGHEYSPACGVSMP